MKHTNKILSSILYNKNNFLIQSVIEQLKFSVGKLSEVASYSSKITAFCNAIHTEFLSCFVDITSSLAIANVQLSI